jgi:AcrR family transcriptional regulator
MGAKRAPKGSVAGRQGYHHGNLREALIDAAESILVEHGPEGFSLREAARRAGVSPAAPQHHFSSAAGLLTEVAVLGFKELTDRLREANGRGKIARSRLIEQGVAYVRFAVAHPGRFQLMFHHRKLLPADERIHAAGRAAYSELEAAVREYLGAHSKRPSDGAVAAMVLAAWSMVHGFAQLALDGKFDEMVEGKDLSSFIDAMLPSTLRLLCR